MVRRFFIVYKNMKILLKNYEKRLKSKPNCPIYMIEGEIEALPRMPSHPTN